MLRRGIFSVLGRLCEVAGHVVDRGHVRHTGHDFVGPCRRCGRELYRDASRRWVPVTAETLADLERIYASARTAVPPPPPRKATGSGEAA